MYELGINLINYFNVVDCIDNEIIVCFGDLFDKIGFCLLDGIFVIRVDVDYVVGVVCFSLKILVFCGDVLMEKSIVFVFVDYFYYGVVCLWMIIGSWGLYK